MPLLSRQVMQSASDTKEPDPIPVPAFVAERHRIEQNLGSSCTAPGGGYHDLRAHYTNLTLLLSLCVVPWLCVRNMSKGWIV
ncbi:hypothetical protein BC936DRAFT_139552 [Jimgerdemannia flammicorona]|uniref:Uncharacterized protein n=1 Tax=Jimgerdemannia flammicorona TaxID=994334 RepID=A0A433B9N3_9FUNG|nr:hypothetical protein BC936DRAFT_139552 [Jimgerdemannia flammicorona]